MVSHGLSSARTSCSGDDLVVLSLPLGNEMTLLCVGSMPQDLAMCNIDLSRPDQMEQHLGALAGAATFVSCLSPV